MTSNRRQLLLKIGAIAIVGLYLLDLLVIEPAFAGWREQSTRITALRTKVERGRQLREREQTIRERWAGMLRANLSPEFSTAQNAAYQAISHWVSASHINLSSLTPQTQWQDHDEGYQTLECRIAATGSQAALGRFIYEMESDAGLPVNLEECELTTRDARGAQLSLTARITFLRLKESKTP